MSNPAVDVLIIGGSYAGLATALALCRQQHTSIVFDSADSRNAGAAHSHMLPTWDGADPGEFRAAARKEIQSRYDSATFKDARVTAVKAEGDGTFSATTNEGVFHGRKLVLATGVTDIPPPIPGYSDCWSSAIFHCLFCHGYEQRGEASAGVLAQGALGASPQMLAHMVGNALQLVPRVTVYTHGDVALAAQAEKIFAANKAVAVNGREIARFEKLPRDAALAIHFADGTKSEEGFLAHSAANALKSDLPAQLGLETNPMGFVNVTPPFNAASVPGVFVAGDAGTMFKFVNAGLYSGTLVAAGVAAALQAEKLGAKFD